MSHLALNLENHIMYDYLFITHLPSFYKVNLYNQLAKKLRVFVIFIASASAIRTNDFVSKEMDFDHKILYDGNFETRPKFRTIVRLLRCISNLNYRMAVVGGWDLSEFWAIVCTLPKAKNAVYVESTIAESKTTGIKSLFKKFFLSRVGTAFPSGLLHQQLLEVLGYRGNSYRTGGVGFLNRQTKTIKERPFSASFLYVGRLAPEKNLALLVEAFNELPHLKLTIVGSGPLDNQLKNCAFHNVSFRSHVPNQEIAEVYQSHDIFVLPSLREPWGLVVDEALYYGLPVIVSTTVGCCSELVQEGSTGFKIDPFDKQSLQKAIIKLSQPEVYNHMKDVVAAIDFNTRYESQILAYVEASKH